MVTVAVTTSPSRPYAVAVRAEDPSVAVASGTLAVYVNPEPVAVTVVVPAVNVTWSTGSDTFAVTFTVSRKRVLAAGVLIEIVVGRLLSVTWSG